MLKKEGREDREWINKGSKLQSDRGSKVLTLRRTAVRLFFAQRFASPEFFIGIWNFYIGILFSKSSVSYLFYDKR